MDGDSRRDRLHGHGLADPNFTNVYRTYTTTYNRLTPRDSWRDNQAGQAYYWNVTPNTLGLDISNVSVFQKRTEGIHRTSPANAAPLPNDFTFVWEDYLDTNQALTPPIPQEATRYRIQVSTVSDFATLIETKIGNTPFYTPFDKTYPEGPIYWRVQAIDGSSNDLTVSQIGGGLVVKTSPAPVLSYPANGADLQGVPYLQWTPLAYAASYDVQIDNDSNFSSPIATATTKMTAWAYTEPLAAGTYTGASVGATRITATVPGRAFATSTSLPLRQRWSVPRTGPRRPRRRSS